MQCSTLASHSACSAHIAAVSGKLVKAAGFEPATFWSQTRRATGLRYAKTFRCPFGLNSTGADR